jgi:hypothetical protein
MRGITIKEAYLDECHIGTIIIDDGKSDEQIKAAMISAIESHFDCEGVTIDNVSYKDAMFMVSKYEKGFFECEVDTFDDDLSEMTIEIESTFIY